MVDFLTRNFIRKSAGDICSQATRLLPPMVLLTSEQGRTLNMGIIVVTPQLWRVGTTIKKTTLINYHLAAPLLLQ